MVIFYIFVLIMSYGLSAGTGAYPCLRRYGSSMFSIRGTAPVRKEGKRDCCSFKKNRRNVWIPRAQLPMFHIKRNRNLSEEPDNKIYWILQEIPFYGGIGINRQRLYNLKTRFAERTAPCLRPDGPCGHSSRRRGPDRPPPHWPDRLPHT